MIASRKRPVSPAPAHVGTMAALSPAQAAAAFQSSPADCAALMRASLPACRRGDAAVGEVVAREVISGRRGKAFLRVDATWGGDARGDVARPFVFEFFDDDDGRKVLWRLRRRYRAFDMRATSAYVPELRAVLRELPFDYRLDTLAHALAPGALAAAANALEGHDACAVTAPEVIRYVPEKRCLVRLSGKTPMLAKVFARSSDLQSARVQSRLHGWHGPDAPSVPRIVGVSEELRVMFQERVPGVPLYDLIKHSGMRLDGLQEGAARALARLHACEVDGLRTHGLRDELDVVSQAVSRSPIAGETRGRAMHVLARLTEAASGLRPASWAFAHRDFYDKQVIVDGPRHVVIDFDTACTSFPELDAGNYVAHLALRAEQRYLTRAAARSQARAFVGAYRRERPALDLPLVRWSAASAWLRLASVYAARPGWQGIPPRMLQLAEEALVPDVQAGAPTGHVVEVSHA